ncbi:MAG: GntP family permease [Treponema sp.]|nr:GntP family permease [Treponema sp.]
MTGMGLIVVFTILIIVMIIMMSKFNVHAFLAMMLVSLALGLIAGIPLVDTIRDGATVRGMTFVIASGFAATIQGIGLVIIFGAMIGMILELTGAAFRLADMVIKVVGQKRPILGIEMMGWIVSIPVFCDSGFVILDPVRKALVKKTKVSSVSASIALSLGLYASHVFIPPTPGPIAAANTLFEGAGLPVNLLLVMGIGVLASIPALIAAYFFAIYIGKRVKSKEDLDVDAITQTYEEIKESYGKMPGSLNAVMPIIVPILLIALGSIAGMQQWTGFGGELARFFGTPFIAIGCGVLFGVLQVKSVGKMDKFYEMCNNTLKVVGPIIFITATSGVLGLTIRETDLVPFINENVGTLTTIGIFLPFILSAILKTAQGSSTVALIITSGIVAPMLGILGLASPVGIALCVMSIAAGSMTVSHANDSYYWVVTNFGGMTPQQGYRVQTLGTLVQGTASIIGVFILSLILL